MIDLRLSDIVYCPTILASVQEAYSSPHMARPGQTCQLLQANLLLVVEIQKKKQQSSHRKMSRARSLYAPVAKRATTSPPASAHLERQSTLTVLFLQKKKALPSMRTSSSTQRGPHMFLALHLRPYIPLRSKEHKRALNSLPGEVANPPALVGAKGVSFRRH